MTVLFDLLATQPVAGYRFHGGADYTKQVLARAVGRGWDGFHAVYNPRLELDQSVAAQCRAAGVKMIEVASWAEIEGLLGAGGYSTFYSGLPYEYADVDSHGVRFVMTIHGLRNLELPVDFTQSRVADSWVGRTLAFLQATRKSERRVRRAQEQLAKLIFRNEAEIVTVSRHSRYSLKSFFPQLDLSRITVAHSPVVELAEQIPADTEQGDYYLLLGADRWVKNVLPACKVLDTLMAEGMLGTATAKVVGMVAPNPVSASLQNGSRFEFIDYVERDELAALIRGARCLLFPSQNEGFGYPPLHAMELETPVIAAATSSVPEVCAAAALYFDVGSMEELRNRVLQVQHDEELCAELVAAGRRRFQELKALEGPMLDALVERIFDGGDHGAR
ncbi:hypothetical protein BST95_19240 [Halioglobus japonicus]|uniref:Glycosyl transferase family 1 domain-containing protein n=1 Tax=Halioglobus japonicus TaxID=930805 RepID=A0AAP8MBF6_9GAMM|nr:glycosyltransferase [Halioglobus japonicus]AQA20057.1 hypothetical protein BST95_19240 [Halioglobus japonicus]PLW84717.1 hypothetical protein C0029_17080 [Halioglobus japonicus]GHD21046.1 mannosyltransferase [Halioglobus japonicus]